MHSGREFSPSILPSCLDFFHLLEQWRALIAAKKPLPYSRSITKAEEFRHPTVRLRLPSLGQTLTKIKSGETKIARS